MEKLFVYSYFPENRQYECYPCRTMEVAVCVAIEKIDHLAQSELPSYKEMEIPVSLQHTINAVKERNLNKAIISWEAYMNLMWGTKSLLHEIKEIALYEATIALPVNNLFVDIMPVVAQRFVIPGPEAEVADADPAIAPPQEIFDIGILEPPHHL